MAKKKITKMKAGPQTEVSINLRMGHDQHASYLAIAAEKRWPLSVWIREQLDAAVKAHKAGGQ